MVTRIPIRLRLTLVFALAMTAVVVGAGWFVYLRVASDLSRALDVQLRSRAQDLSALVLRGGSLRTTSDPLVEHGELFAQLLSLNGRVLDATSSIGRARLLTRGDLALALRAPRSLDRSSVPGLDEPARMLAVPLARDGRQLVLVVGATSENRSESLRSLGAAFLVGGPIALLLASLGGYLLAGAALRPIEAMRRRAAEISASTLDERLPVPQARDEVARLGITLNEMLTRIEDGLARELRFVSDASHELRTPLALVKTELELALRRSRTPEELEATIRSVAAETDRLAQIADDLLLLARSEQGQLPLHVEPVDIEDVLETVAGRFRARAGADSRTISVETDDAPVIDADRLRLEQAFGNLVDNALRHGRGQIALSAVRADGTVELHVRDAGGGFPPVFIARAFDRFARAHDSLADGGSGLGLSIVETIARAHAGGAHAANRVGGGADVWISLPLSA